MSSETVAFILSLVGFVPIIGLIPAIIAAIIGSSYIAEGMSSLGHWGFIFGVASVVAHSVKYSPIIVRKVKEKIL